MKIIRFVMLPLFLMALFTCEDLLTPLIEEDVRVARLPDRVLNILPPSNGTVVPQGSLTVKDNEPVGVSATPNGGYSFMNWVQTAGAGATVFGDVGAATTTVRVTGGDATIQPIISNTPRNLTMTNDGHGTTDPAGTVQVGDGQPRNIEAIPNGAAGYEFDAWSKTGGGGTVDFGDSSDQTTTVTVTGGDATIHAAFKLKHYTVTLANDTHGTTTPNGAQDFTHGSGVGVSTTPATGYRFKNWTVTVGSGIAFAPNATTTPVTITATGGNATVQANFELIPYTLTIAAGTGGWVSPSGAQTVSYGVPYQLHAYPYGTYKFVNWTKTAGTGTVVFSPGATDANATATVTGGNATIQANFAKENVTLTEVGTLALGNFTTYPSEAKDIYFYNNYLYVLGSYNASNSVVRRFNVSNPAAPSSIQGEDFRYANGVPRAVIGDGTYLFVGTESTGGNIYRIPLSNFPSGTITNPSTAVAVDDLAMDPSSTTLFWAITGGQVLEFTRLNFYTGNYVINPDAGSFTYIEKTPYALLAIQDDNGANQMSSYDVDGTTGATWTAPDSTIAVHSGADMDPGDAGRIATHPDGEWVAVPVDDPYDGYAVRTYWTDDPYGISYRGEALLSGDPRQVFVDDYYIYVAAEQGGAAYIYVIDAYNPAAPVVRTSFQVTSFEWVDAVYVNGNYLYAIVDSAAAAKPTLKVYQITRS